MSTAQNKIAGAPISWGVCEVPGWGYQLPPDRVLTEMREPWRLFDASIFVKQRSVCQRWWSWWR